MPELITHKATADCIITGPHDRDLCGIVRARLQRSASMQEEIERQLEAERIRTSKTG
jgi:hypothetical protein